MFINVLGSWIRGLLSIVLLVAGAILIKEWVNELPRDIRVRDASGHVGMRPLDTFGERLSVWRTTPDRSIVPLAAGTALLLFGMAGRFVSPWAWRRGGPSPAPVRPLSRRLGTRNGYDLHVEIHGAKGSPAMVLVHGVGSDRTQWRELIEDLQDQFQIYTFDLLGHGKSDHRSDAEHTLESAARDLDDVITLTGRDKVVVVGHSMGGMILQVWCTTHPSRLDRLAGMVLVHTTPQNPFRTMRPVPLHRALQKRLHEPVLRLTTKLAPLVRFMNALGYLNGTTHWSNDRAMFGASESRQQLERTAQLHLRMDPGAVARFTLAMARFDVRDRLRELDVHALVVVADRDGVTIPEAGSDIANRIPGAESIVLDRTRHMGFMERRFEFAEAVGRFHEEASAATPRRKVAGR